MSTKSKLMLPPMAVPKTPSKDIHPLPHPSVHPMPLPSLMNAGGQPIARQSRHSALAPSTLNQIGPVNEAVVEPIKKKKPNFSTRKATKIRVSLPKISSYETELEYQADAPGRVLVRLERLMGTDRVRITDPRYMQTLLRRLEEDELKDWFKRSKLRKRAELNRYRQLAIEGHMEPGPDMQDLYQHPVFRVNRILNRLAKLDDVLASTTLKPPKITITEPFEDFAKTGFLFGFHKDHYLRSKTEYQHSGKEDSGPDTTKVDSVPELHMSKSERKRAAASRHKIIQDKIRQQAQSKEQEWGGEDYAVEEMPDEEGESENEEDDEYGLELDEDGVLQDGSIFQAKAYYGIKAEDDLETAWTTQRSPLIDLLYKDDVEETNMMFEFAKEIMATYRREQLKTDDFCQKVHRKLFL